MVSCQPQGWQIICQGMGSVTVRVDGLTESISTFVRMLMARERLTQAGLADRMGIDQAVISNRLRGVSRWTADDLVLLGRAFGVHPGVFFGDPKGFTPALVAVSDFASST